MKFIVDMFGREVLVSAEQLESLVDLLVDAECIGQEHVGEGNGNAGWKGAYIEILQRVDVRDIRAKMLPQESYDAIAAMTKMRNQST